MIKRTSLINPMLVYLLFFVSGSLLFKQSSQTFLLLVFAVSALAWILFSDRKINDRFVVYLSVFAGFLLSIHVYTDGSLQLTAVIGTTLELLLAYLILQTVGKDFVEAFIKVIVVLAVVSLFGFLSDQLHLFDNLIRSLPQVGNNGHEGILYVYRYRYAGYDRNNSIFFEPGAYQGFLNAALYMLLFAKTELTSFKRWVYILLLVVTLYTTFSTTGYLIFAVMFGVFLFKGDVLSGSSKAILVSAFLASAVIFSAQFHEVVFEKIDRYLSIQAITDNDTHKRSFDMLVDLEIFKRHPFGVGFKTYWEEFSAIGQVSMGNTSSNGVTKMLAVFGLPFSVFLFGSYYWALGRLLGGLLRSVIPFGMLMMFFVGEAYYVLTPFCLALIAAPFVYNRLAVDEVSEQKPSIAAHS